MAHRVGQRAQTPDLRFLTRRDARVPFFVGGARGEVLRIGAAVFDEFAFVEMQHACDRLVEQLEVVTDHEQRAAVRTQKAHEPGLRVDIEVVRRLVEHQQVAAREQDARELDATAFTTGERADRQIETIGTEAEPRTDPTHFRFRGVPARGLERVLGGGVALDVAFRRIGIDLQAQLFELAGRNVEAAPGEHMRERRAVEAGAAGRRVLGEVSDRGRPQHDTARRGRSTCDDFHHRGLARAVAADQADLVAGSQRERRVDEGLDPRPRPSDLVLEAPAIVACGTYGERMKWNVHGERVLYDCEWLTLALTDVEVPDGDRFEHHVLRMPNQASGTVVHDRQRGVLLLWRHRFITDTWGWEVPAGRIDPGETPEEAARRETLEETGGSRVRWRSSSCTTPRTVSATRYSTASWRRGATHRGAPTDPSESERVEWVPVSEVRRIVRDGEMPDGLSLTAVLYALVMGLLD